MTRDRRDKLMYRVLREMRFAKTDAFRYRLQRIGESLLGEWRDLRADDIEAVLNEFSARNTQRAAT